VIQPDDFSPEYPGLLVRHVDHLLRSAISPDVIRERGYVSVTKILPGKLADDTTPDESLPGEVPLGRYGFKQMQLVVPSLLIPLYGPEGSVVLHQLRPDTPRKNQSGDDIKYETPGRRNLRIDIPPRCIKDLGDPAVPLFITEGAKKADALASAGVCAINILGVWGWKGTNDKGGKTILADFDRIAFNDGRPVFLTFDSDIVAKPQVKMALDRLTEHLVRRGSRVKIVYLPQDKDGKKTGVDDYLATGHVISDVIALSQDAGTAPGDTRTRKSPGSGNYSIKESRHCKIYYNKQNDDWDQVPLCDFTAMITDDYQRDDGQDAKRWYTIRGRTSSGHELPEVNIEATRFASMQWLAEYWGSDAQVFPGSMNKEHVAAAIRDNSEIIRKRRYYTHTGWIEINGRRVFLTEAGAIGDESVVVDQDPRLKSYRIPKPAMDPATAFRGSLEFLDVAITDMTLPLWAAMYLAPLSSVLEPSFTIWCTGESGSYKSTISALALCHYGSFSAKHLPTSWDTTSNRLEYLLFLAKDIPCLVDDYAPMPDINGQRQLDNLVNRIVRNMGNRQTRGRLQAAGVAQKDYFPRGLLISSGEQVPGGHSISARYFQVPFTKDFVNMDQLTREQANTVTYRAAAYYYLDWLRDEWDELTRPMLKQWEGFRNLARSSQTDGVHSRLPEEVATLYMGLITGLMACVHYGAIDQARADELASQGWETLIRISASQDMLIREERPAEKYLEALRSLLGARKIFFRDKDSELESIPPNQTLVGWTDNMGHPGIMYLNEGIAYQMVHEFYSHSGQAMTMRPPAIKKDLIRQGHIAIPDISPNDKHMGTALIRIGTEIKRVMPLKREAIDPQYKPFSGGG
jgi:hypothetical protein